MVFLVQGSEQVCTELSRVAEFIRCAVTQFTSVTEVQELVEEEKRRLLRELRTKDVEVASLRKAGEATAAKVEAQALRVAALEVEVADLKTRETERVSSQAG